ncbi:MAG: hypothetical protein HON53_18595, partial [Planctomycetaceae bacterium]|nr:hypothetical protein [Planctomycetaceae bacterium]
MQRKTESTAAPFTPRPIARCVIIELMQMKNADNTNEISRRRFLEAAGFSMTLAALGGCGRAPTENALPFVTQPEGTIPGRSRSYASTCGGCPAACGLLVGVRDGRPLKMEGMPEHPLSRGGLCAIGQALPLELYDRLRLQHPLQQGKQVDWKDIDRAIAKQLSEIAAKQGAVRFVTSTVTSPTLKSSINQFLSSFDNAQHVTFDAISCSAILDAHEQTHGVRVLPHFRFDQARVIASFGADFLGTWISPVEFTAAWRAGRVPTETDAEMSHHTHLEDRMSLTGSNADRRFRLSPDDYGGVLSHLATRLVKLSDVPPPAGKLTASPIPDKEVAHLADRLWESRGASLVVCDSQDIAVQSLVNFINHLLGNYGETIDIARPSYQRQGNDRDVIALIEELNAGQVDALFVAGNDLTHNLPEHAALVEAIKQVPLVVSFAEREDDFSSLAHFVCPDHHPLESWLDAEQVNGLVSLSQPTLQPLGETRSILESLNRWVGN